MPFKANADRRHRIPKQRQKVTNWAEYDAGIHARVKDGQGEGSWQDSGGAMRGAARPTQRAFVP
jgi:hypothetical protein